MVPDDQPAGLSGDNAAGGFKLGFILLSCGVGVFIVVVLLCRGRHKRGNSTTSKESMPYDADDSIESTLGRYSEVSIDSALDRYLNRTGSVGALTHRYGYGGRKSEVDGSNLEQELRTSFLDDMERERAENTHRERPESSRRSVALTARSAPSHKLCLIRHAKSGRINLVLEEENEDEPEDEPEGGCTSAGDAVYLALAPGGHPGGSGETDVEEGHAGVSHPARLQAKQRRYVMPQAGAVTSERGIDDGASGGQCKIAQLGGEARLSWQEPSGGDNTSSAAVSRPPRLPPKARSSIKNLLSGGLNKIGSLTGAPNERSGDSSNSSSAGVSRPPRLQPKGRSASIKEMFSGSLRSVGFKGVSNESSTQENHRASHPNKMTPREREIDREAHASDYADMLAHAPRLPAPGSCRDSFHSSFATNTSADSTIEPDNDGDEDEAVAFSVTEDAEGGLNISLDFSVDAIAHLSAGELAVLHKLASRTLRKPQATRHSFPGEIPSSRLGGEEACTRKPAMRRVQSMVTRPATPGMNSNGKQRASPVSSSASCSSAIPIDIRAESSSRQAKGRRFSRRISLSNMRSFV